MHCAWTAQLFEAFYLIQPLLLLFGIESPWLVSSQMCETREQLLQAAHESREPRREPKKTGSKTSLTVA